MIAPTSTHYVLIDYENIQPKNLLLLAQPSFHIAFFVGPSQETIRIEVLDLMQRLGNDRVKHIKVEDRGKNSLDFHLVYYLGRLIERNPDGHYHVISKDNGYDPLVSHLGKRRVKAFRHDDINHIPLIKASLALPCPSGASLVESHPGPIAPAAQPMPNPPKDVVIQLGRSSNPGKSPLLALASANFLQTSKKQTAAAPPKPSKKPQPATVSAKSLPPATTQQSAVSGPSFIKTSTPADKVALVRANLNAHKANRPRSVKTLANHIRAMFQKAKLTDSSLQSLIDTLQGSGVLKVEGTKVTYPSK